MLLPDTERTLSGALLNMTSDRQNPLRATQQYIPAKSSLGMHHTRTFIENDINVKSAPKTSKIRQASRHILINKHHRHKKPNDQMQKIQTLNHKESSTDDMINIPMAKELQPKQIEIVKTKTRKT